MQLLLISSKSTSSKSTRPVAKASILVALALCAGFGTPPVQAQSRRAKTSASRAKAPASNRAAKIGVLEARMRKATATYNAAMKVYGSYAIFQVQGKIEGGDMRRLVVYGYSYGQNQAATQSLGQNTEERFLTILNPDPGSISSGFYRGDCIALGQTEFTTAPAGYFTARATLVKYEALTDSLQNEIEFERQSGARAARARGKVKVAQAKQDKARQAKAQTSQHESVYDARVALSDRETAAKLAQLDSLLAGASDKGGAYLQSSAAATALFNKWGALGVANRTLLWRAFDDLAQAAACQVEGGDWTGATQSAERLVSLELFSLSAPDAQTGKERVELGVDPGGVPGAGQLSSKAVNFVMHREGQSEGQEPLAATKLAQVWLSKLPVYIAGPAPREAKLRVAELSQLLGADVFAEQAGRTRTIAVAVDALRGSYGPGALAVLPQFVPAVEAAKRVRVARQVEIFGQLAEPNAPIESPRVARTFAEAPGTNALGTNALGTNAPGTNAPGTNAPSTNAPGANQPEPAPQTPAAPKEVEKPAAKPLVPAVDFVMRSFKTGRKVRLSAFRGKTVILYFWDALWMEIHDVSPTPVEQLFALSKRYDPQKVVFLLVNENGFADETVKDYREITDTTPDAKRDQRRGFGPRLYPEVAYGLEMGTPKSAGDIAAERVVSEAALASYTGNKNPSWNAMRVTVINPAGQVVGDLDFEEDQAASLFNDKQQRGQGPHRVYDFNEAALEDMMVRAMASQP